MLYMVYYRRPPSLSQFSGFTKKMGNYYGKKSTLEHRAGTIESSELQQFIFKSCDYWHSLFSSVQKLLFSVKDNNLPHNQELVTLLTIYRS